MTYLAGIGPLGPFEIVLILAVVIIVFGVGKLPQVGGSLGKAVREFRSSVKEGAEEEPQQDMTASTPPQLPETTEQTRRS
jgi:sec-independent protein translocase protein TatA